MGNEGMPTSNDKRAMKKALERTRAIQTRAERKDEFASHYDSLKAKYEKIYKSSFNCFSKGKEFKEHWNQQFVLSADKIADIFALFYKERGNDTDEALKKAFELDEKIGRYCNKRRDYLNDTFGELTKKEFLMEKNITFLLIVQRKKYLGRIRHQKRYGGSPCAEIRNY